REVEDLGPDAGRAVGLPQTEGAVAGPEDEEELTLKLHFLERREVEGVSARGCAVGRPERALAARAGAREVDPGAGPAKPGDAVVGAAAGRLGRHAEGDRALRRAVAGPGRVGALDGGDEDEAVAQDRQLARIAAASRGVGEVGQQLGASRLA